MQAVAAEMNLPESAFVAPRADGAYDLRWFTPTTEIDLCGHATLATAHVLWEDGRADPAATLEFHTRSGVLTAAPLGDGWIELDFPIRPPEPTDLPEGVEHALGTAVVAAGLNSEGYLAVELETPEAVASLAPDTDALSRHRLAYIVTAAGGPDGCDYVVRAFLPAWGIPEDPVTGAAQCVLAPWWAERLGKTQFVSHQVSARGGVLRTTLRGERVGIAGQAVTVLRGSLTS